MTRVRGAVGFGSGDHGYQMFYGAQDGVMKDRPGVPSRRHKALGDSEMSLPSSSQSG